MSTKVTPAVKTETAKAQKLIGNGQEAKNQKPELSNLVVSGDLTKDEVNNPEEVTKPDEVKPAIVQTEAEKKFITIEEKLDKLDEFNELVEKRDTVVEALKNVGNFYISPAGNAHLKFQDSKGNSFGIAHPSVIGEMVTMAKAKLQAELDRIDSQINFWF